MSRNDLLNKNWLANSFRNFCKRNDFPENFVRQSLANMTRVARITNFKKNLDWVALPSKFYFGWLKKKSNSTGNQNQIDNLRVAFQLG